jgi:hypothetical protein
MTKFHGDVYRIRDDRDFLSMMNAATNLGGCCTRTQSDKFPILDHLRRSQTNSTLFGALHLLLRAERRKSSERFVQQRFDLNRAAMSSTQKSRSFKIAKFAADCRWRSLETFSQSLNRHLSIS